MDLIGLLRSLPAPANFLQLLVLFLVLIATVGFVACAWSKDRDLHLRVSGISLICALTILSETGAVYFVSVFLVGTAITKLEFLEKLAAIVRGNKEYFDLQKAIAQAGSSNPTDESPPTTRVSEDVPATLVVDAVASRPTSATPVVKKGIADNVVRSRLQDAYLLLARREHERALGAYDEILRIDSACGEAVLGKCRILTRLDRHTDSLTVAEEFVRNSPNDAYGYVASAIALLGAQRFDEAVHASSKAISLSPDLAIAFTVRASALRGLGRLDKAKADTQKARELDPNDEWAIALQASFALDEKKYKEAVELASDALGINPYYVYARNTRASAYRRLKNYEEARRDAERAIEIAPHRLSARQILASICLDLGDYDGAIEEATRAIETNEKDSYGWWQRAEARRFKKEFEAAIEDSTAAIELSPTFLAPRNVRAACLNALGKHAEAAEDAAFVLKVDPNSKFAKYQLEMANRART